MINYGLIPEHCRNSVRAYIEEHKPLGGFLTAVFSNNLVEAFGKADRVNSAYIRDYANFLYNEVPLSCWGNRKMVEAWIALGKDDED